MFGQSANTINTLVNDVTSSSPSALSWAELEKLQAFVNRGKSATLLKDYPDLQTIFSTHVGDGPRDRNAIVDILFAFIQEGGQIGSTLFRDMVNKMVEKNYLKGTVIDALGDFLPAGSLTDGDRIHDF